MRFKLTRDVNKKSDCKTVFLICLRYGRSHDKLKCENSFKVDKERFEIWVLEDVNV